MTRRLSLGSICPPAPSNQPIAHSAASSALLGVGFSKNVSQGLPSLKPSNLVAVGACLKPSAWVTVGACLKPSNVSAVGACLKPSNCVVVGAAAMVGAVSTVGARSMVGTGRNSGL